MSDIEYDRENYEHDQRPQEEKPPEPPVEIPPEMLSDEAMKGVVENFILREGTDYGATETSYETKALQIRRQMERGDIKIVYDPNSESVTLMTSAAFKKLF